MRCEADLWDGGVCLTRLHPIFTDEPCSNERDHALTSSEIGRTYVVSCPRCSEQTTATLTGYSPDSLPVWWVHCLCVPACVGIRPMPAHFK